MEPEETYRDHRIVVRRGTEWSARIHPMGGILNYAFNEAIFATLDEGRAVLMERCRQAIDADIEGRSA